MQLIVDRFAVIDRRTTIDLATGDRVDVAVRSAGGESEQRRWMIACGARQAFHHPSRATLVDYGLIGETQRFEAWRAARWSAPANVLGLMTIARPVVMALGELLERADALRPRVAAIWGPRGAGKTTVVAALARIARLYGFVPVAAHLVPCTLDALSGRSLFVIDDGGVQDGWKALLYAASRSDRPHVVLRAGRENPPGVEGVALAPLPLDDLVNAVRPRQLADRSREALRRMAVRAEGWPGRFAQLLWRGTDRGHAEAGRPRQLKGAGPAMGNLSYERPAVSGMPQPTFTGPGLGTVRAREQAAVYQVDGHAPPGTLPQGLWAPVGDVRALQHRMEAGNRLMADGRHGPGERLLRQTVGALARREQWRLAADGALALATGLLDRGRVRDARSVLDLGGEYCRRAGDEQRLLHLAILSGTVAIDLARPDEAETRLTSAVAAARARRDPVQLSRASAALARALFWSGRYDAAERALGAVAPRYGPVDSGSMSPADADDRAVPPTDVGSAARGAERSGGAADQRWRSSIAGLRSVIAIGAGQVPHAMALVTDALSRAHRRGDWWSIAEASSRAAFVHLAAGDLRAVAEDATVSIAAARRAHAPLVSIRVRLLLVEALRRSGRKAAATRLLARITRLRGTALPPILRVRCDLLRDLISTTSSSEQVVARHVAATGVGALALFVPRRSPADHQGFDIMVDDIVGILDLCQTSDDEGALLTEVSRRVRTRLHAAAAGVAVAERGAVEVLASDGGRLDRAIAERAIALGLTIDPHRADDRIEAAAPVRYGGTVIGALVARWPIGTLHDLSPASSLLTTVAAVVAPIVSGATVRRCRAADVATASLIGSSPGIVEVRRGIDHAGPAPFPVLIEGESGSGKELVARAIHRASPRRDRPFCTLNCAALPDELVEAELFGHARGAFTGAVADRPGVFEQAHGGTLMLDEIGDLSLRAQAKVLRVIQEGELRRVGDQMSRRVDARIVSATNRNLRDEVTAGRFRLDLLYRLDVLRIAVPPLRDRREDIPELVERIWRDAAARVGSRAMLAAATVAALARYDWPGNVRELQNVLASLVVRSAKRGVVGPSALGPQFADRPLVEASRLDAARRSFDERFVRAALVRTGGHRGRAAEELGVTRQGLAKLMTRLGIGAEPRSCSD